jgi:hypothetical protein
VHTGCSRCRRCAAGRRGPFPPVRPHPGGDGRHRRPPHRPDRDAGRRLRRPPRPDRPILAPLLALTITTGVVPAIALDDLYWQDDLGGAYPARFGPGISPPPFGQVHPGWRGPRGGWSGRR